MLTLKCRIEIETKREGTKKNISFDYVHSITVNTSMKNLSDTATIRVPRNMYYKGKSLYESIKKEDKVTIKMGYEERKLETVFVGYLTEKENSAPLMLKCENAMYWFEQYKIDESDCMPSNDFDIETFIKKHTKKLNVECKKFGDFTLGFVKREPEMKVADVLESVQKEHPYVDCFFRNDVFYIVEDGEMENSATQSFESSEEKLQENSDRKIIVFDPTRNMISDELQFEHSDDKKICVKAVSVTSENEQLVAYAPEDAAELKGDKKVAKDGYEERFRYCSGYETQPDLQKHASCLFKQVTATRMTKHFTALGVPFVRKGDIVELHDEEREERHKKKFIVEAVDYTFSAEEKTSGYRQKITLGRQVE